MFSKINFSCLLIQHNSLQFMIFKKWYFLPITHTSGTAAFIPLQKRISLILHIEKLTNTIRKEIAWINIVRSETFKVMLYIPEAWSVTEIYLENYFSISSIVPYTFHNNIGRQNCLFLKQLQNAFYILKNKY